MSKPSIFLIHGAYHTPAHIKPLTDVLKAQGYEVVGYQNPSSINLPLEQIAPDSAEAKTTLSDDASFLRPHLKKLVDEGKEVFVGGHSYGGCITSELVTKELTLEARKEQGLKGGVIGLMYLCAFMLPNGGVIEPPTWVDIGDYEFAVIDEKHGVALAHGNAAKYFYNDMTPKEQEYYTSLLKPWAVGGMQPVSHAAQSFVPPTYVICEEDKAIRPELQRSMIARAKQDGIDVREVVLNASHSPFISQPEAVAKEIEGAIAWSRQQIK